MARARTKPTKEDVGNSGVGVPTEQSLLVQEEIWRIVSDAAETGSRLSLARTAQKIASDFPTAELSPVAITDALVFAAIEAGVAFETRLPARRHTVVVPGLIALVGGRRKSRGEGRAQPTLAGVPMPAT